MMVGPTAEATPEALIEPTAVARAPIDLPRFLSPRIHVPVPPEATCRRQGRDVLECLTRCCRAYHHGDAPPPWPRA